jgi:hypothetical protein
MRVGEPGKLEKKEEASLEFVLLKDAPSMVSSPKRINES